VVFAYWSAAETAPATSVLGCTTMKLREIGAPDFDLAMTLNSGQVFHWEKQGCGFVGAVGQAAVYVQ